MIENIHFETHQVLPWESDLGRGPSIHWLALAWQSAGVFRRMFDFQR